MISNPLLESLRNIAQSVLEQCVRPATPDLPPVAIPSADMTYTGFWVRDAAMGAQAALFPPEMIREWIVLICLSGVNKSGTIRLDNGLSVPPWCVADHFNFEGGAVYFPGTYSSAADQGNGDFGFFPPFDDQYYFIDMLWSLYTQDENAADFLAAPISGGLSPLQIAENVFYAHSLDTDSGLCQSAQERYTVDWGFCDSIKKTGYLLFPSLLRFDSGRKLSKMLSGTDGGLAAKIAADSEKLRAAINKTFVREDGWLASATGMSNQPDVWGTAFAVWCGACDDAVAASKTLVSAYREGKISADGYVRHIPTGFDHSGESCWEGCRYGIDNYQNGGYWATPTGWVAYAMQLTDRSAGAQILEQFAAHTEKFWDIGAPYEWKHQKAGSDGRIADTKTAGHKYMTSAANPYTAAKRIASEQG